MYFSNDLIEKAKIASSAEELLEMAAKEGIELSAADAEMYFSFMKNNGPLSDEELESVTGGKATTSARGESSDAETASYQLYYKGLPLRMDQTLEQFCIAYNVDYSPLGWYYVYCHTTTLYDLCKETSQESVQELFNDKLGAGVF